MRHRIVTEGLLATSKHSSGLSVAAFGGRRAIKLSATIVGLRLLLYTSRLKAGHEALLLHLRELVELIR